MPNEKDLQLLEILTRCVHELRAMQEAGRMQDAASRAEIEFLEQELRAAEARAGGGARELSRETADVPDDRSARRRDSEAEGLPNQDP